MDILLMVMNSAILSDILVRIPIWIRPVYYGFLRGYSTLFELILPAILFLFSFLVSAML